MSVSGTVGDPAAANATPFPTSMPDTFEYGSLRMVCWPVFGSIRTTSHFPPRVNRATRCPSGSNPYVTDPNTQCGTPNSASIGSTGTILPSRSAYRFHQFVRSETKYSVPSGDHAG